MRCPQCGGPGGVALFTSVAPCNRCHNGTVQQSEPVKLVYPSEPPGTPNWSGYAWPPPVGARVVKVDMAGQPVVFRGGKLTGTVIAQGKLVRVAWDHDRLHPMDGYARSDLAPTT